MNDYISLRVDASPCSSDITDLIADALADAGYESFEPDDTGLTAYVPAEKYDADAVAGMLDDFPIPTQLSFSAQRIEGKDWNAEWEKNYFQPILIADRCLIHSSFHTDLPEARYDIVIDPKMAFGTGHHSTTSLIVGYMLDMDIAGKSVIDMGTGTGILAILASMLGAAEAEGIEIDPMAHANAVDNARLNGVDIRLTLGDASALPDHPAADLFIANINRNIILADLPYYVKTLRPGATMLLSGFYEKDIPMIERSANRLGLTLAETRTDHDWAAIRLTYNG